LYATHAVKTVPTVTRYFLRNHSYQILSFRVHYFYLYYQMKSASFILLTLFLISAIPPVFIIHNGNDKVNSTGTMKSCCSKSRENKKCGSNSGTSQKTSRLPCTGGNGCNPFLPCMGCLFIPSDSPSYSTLIALCTNTKSQLTNQVICSGYYGECWHPPELHQL
jgi:hypothetical protein